MDKRVGIRESKELVVIPMNTPSSSVDGVVIMVPKYISEKGGERSLDLEDLVLRAFREALNLDPVEVARARVEIAEKNLKASEKLYRTTEECTKALAEKLSLQIE